MLTEADYGVIQASGERGKVPSTLGFAEDDGGALRLLAIGKCAQRTALVL